MSRIHGLLPHLSIPERARGLIFRTFLALFSWIWILQIAVPFRDTWRNEPSWGIRFGIVALTVPFVVAYSYAIFRIYFHRRSWSFIYTIHERWILRLILAATSVSLVAWRGNDWALTLIYTAMVVIITAPPSRVFRALFQALIINVGILLLIPVETSMMVSVLLISFVLGMLVASQMQQLGEMGELVEARYTEARIAAAEERLRIARDLHDVLGHTLSLVTLKSELASRLVDADPARAQQEMRDVETIARSAMAEVRRTVSGERQPVLTSEIDAARQLLAAADIDVQVDDDGRSLPNEVAALFAWSLREGVTNVVRHSRARHCTISLQSDTDVAQLTILDDGPASGAPGSGTGIPSLRQRAEEMGGSVSFETTSDQAGHRLCLRAPISTAEGVE